jgi:hypothetical protein
MTAVTIDKPVPGLAGTALPPRSAAGARPHRSILVALALGENDGMPTRCDQCQPRAVAGASADDGAVAADDVRVAGDRDRRLQERAGVLAAEHRLLVRIDRRRRQLPSLTWSGAHLPLSLLSRIAPALASPARCPRP